MSRISQKNLVLTAMVFAVAMTFIDQTIVSIAIPEIQTDLDLSSTGVQWVINGYLLSLSALFAFGGRAADVFGHRRMVVLGVVVFATASVLCGLTPHGSISEAWIILFRVIQGAGAAIMFPAALAIVIAAFPIGERGKAMAIFFGVTGGLTAIGPLAGGYLSEWTWRSIFWVNVPVAVIALLLTAKSKPSNQTVPGKVDYRGTVLIALGIGLAVLGLQQSTVWGWDSVATWLCIVVGILLVGVFVRFELRQESPLIKLRLFADRAFAAESGLIFLLSLVFVPFFFFASMYSQISLGYDASTAGLYLVIFFGGFAWGSQVGGRILDARGARHAVVMGPIVAAVGFYLLAHQMTVLSLNSQWIYLAMAGFGSGMLLSPASTDAINRAPVTAYGEASGITQTMRYVGSSIGLAILGSILITQNRLNLEDKFPKPIADKIADGISHSAGASGSGPVSDKVLGAIQGAFASSTQTVFYVMAGIMALCAVVAFLTVPAGKMELVEGEAADQAGPPSEQ